MEIKLSPLAYISIFQHCVTHAKKESLIYGLLTGFIEDNIPHIKSYIPLTHANSPIDFETNHGIFHQMDQFNAENHDPEFISDEIIGWVRSFPSDSIEDSEIDRKNHIYLQTAYCDQAVALFIPPDGDQYGMVLKNFSDPLPEIDLTSDFIDIDWNFDEIEDLDDLFQIVIDLQVKRKEKSTLVSEVFAESTSGN